MTVTQTFIDSKLLKSTHLITVTADADASDPIDVSGAQKIGACVEDNTGALVIAVQTTPIPADLVGVGTVWTTLLNGSAANPFASGANGNYNWDIGHARSVRVLRSGAGASTQKAYLTFS